MDGWIVHGQVPAVHSGTEPAVRRPGEPADAGSRTANRPMSARSYIALRWRLLPADPRVTLPTTRTGICPGAFSAPTRALAGAPPQHAPGPPDQEENLVSQAATNSRRSAVAVLATLAVLAFVVAGCGGDDPAGTPGTAPASASPAAPSPTVDAESAEARTRALEVYGKFREAHVAASAAADPQGGDLAKYVADPLLTQLRNDLYIRAQQGIVTTGRPVWNPTVTTVNVSARPFTVELEDCFDATAWKTVFKSSSKDAAVPNQAKKYLVQAKVVQYDDGRWLVNTAKAERERPC
jgi:hypothetical protein